VSHYDWQSTSFISSDYENTAIKISMQETITRLNLFLKITLKFRWNIYRQAFSCHSRRRHDTFSRITEKNVDWNKTAREYYRFDKAEYVHDLLTYRPTQLHFNEKRLIHRRSHIAIASSRRADLSRDGNSPIGDGAFSGVTASPIRNKLITIGYF